MPYTVSPAIRKARERGMEPLTAWRKSHGITLVHVAKRLGIHRQRLYDYEHGLARPPDWVIVQLAQEYRLADSLAQQVIETLGPPRHRGRPTRTVNAAMAAKPAKTAASLPTATDVPVARPPRRKRAS